MMRGWTLPLVSGALVGAALWAGCAQEGTTPRCSEAPLYGHRYDSEDREQFDCFIKGNPVDSDGNCQDGVVQADASAAEDPNTRYNNIRENVVPNDDQPDLSQLTSVDEDCLTGPENPEDPDNPSDGGT